MRGLSIPDGCIRFVYNDLYSVQFYEHNTCWGLVVRLIIRRHDSTKPGCPWSHKQRIKTELMGADRMAVEVFPAEEDLIDQAHCYHLWVFPEDFSLPFGLDRNGAGYGES